VAGHRVPLAAFLMQPRPPARPSWLEILGLHLQRRPDAPERVAESGAHPHAVLGALVEGAVLTILRHVPEERREETALALVWLLEERLKARSAAGDDRPGM
jgi:hypothetical protein